MTSPAAAATTRAAAGSLVQRLREREAVLVGAVVVAGAVFTLTNENFLTTLNLTNIAVQSSMILLIAYGMTVVIASGGIDLSVGSTAAVVGVLTVWLIANAGVPAVPAMLAGLVLGATIGLLHGLVISRLRVPDFITTLATLTTLRGVAFLIGGGFAIRSTDPQLAFIANGELGPIPIPIVIAAVGFVLIHVLLSQTPFGRSFYAVGGNREAARLTGVNVRGVIVLAYVISGVLTAVAGLIAASRTAAGSPIIGMGWELQAITIVILGGANLFGGSGTVVGTLLAGLFLGMLNNWMSLEGVRSWLQGVVVGILLITVVALNQRERRRRTRRLHAGTRTLATSTGVRATPTGGLRT